MSLKSYCGTLLLLAGLVGCPAGKVWAEGSKELNAFNTHRLPIEYNNATTAGIPRYAPVRVFVKQGETVNLGSSVRVNGVPSFAGQDISYASPSNIQTGSCNVNSPPGFGLIDTVAKENAGPQAAGGANPTGYVPCSFVAAETGIYSITFRSVNPNDASPAALLATDDNALLDINQGSGIAAWDITIRDGNNTFGTERTGRVFFPYLPTFVGANNRSVSPRVYVQTKDGYLYSTRLNNIDPNGFIIMANSRGFIDQTNNSTLYHSITSSFNTMNPLHGNVIVQPPTVPDTATNITHLIFLNPPDPDTLTHLGIPLTAVPPPTPSAFQFTGSISGNQTTVGSGGTFTFNSTAAGSYQLIIDTNNDNIFDPATDRVLQNPAVVGSNSVVWDGKDANGNNVPALPGNAPYTALVRIRTGEYHIPILDAENLNTPGGLTIELLNAPVPFPPDLDTNNQPVDKFTIYYNNTNYTTANGTPITLTGPGAPTPALAIKGINSQAGVLSFTNNWGDRKGVHVWTYLAGSAVTTPLVILNNTPNLLFVKRITQVNGVDINTIEDDPSDPNDNNPRWPANYLRGAINQTNLKPGDEVEYTIYYLNASLLPASQVRICDRLDPNLVFQPTAFNASSPSDGGLPADKGIALAIGSTTPTFYLTNINDPPDRGQFVPPPTVPPNCNITSNPNGTVVVNVTRTTGVPTLPQIPNATGAGIPPESYGFVRFRVRIK
jgi:uncharacterized repeat protein (TIGR01451 family)